MCVGRVGPIPKFTIEKNYKNLSIRELKVGTFMTCIIQNSPDKGDD